MQRITLYCCPLLAAVMVAGCTTIPSGLHPVEPFDVNRYLGTWYEIARLDHSFERGLSQVTAEYSRRDDGSIQVVNRGYDAESNRWREARAVADFAGPTNQGSLKVTFVWPFSGAYNIIALDQEQYQYAMVTSSSRSYLWILSRQKRLNPTIVEDLLTKARQWGFRVEDVLWVEH